MALVCSIVAWISSISSFSGAQASCRAAEVVEHRSLLRCSRLADALDMLYLVKLILLFLTGHG